MRTILPFVFLLLTVVAPAGAQDVPPDAAPDDRAQLEIVDQVAAVVGDSVILYSEVLEGLQQRRAELEAAGEPLPTEPEELEALELELLEGLINNQLLLQAAQADTMVSVTDDMVERAFESEWQTRVQQLGGEDNLRQALAQQGQSLADFRAGMREQARRNLLVGQFFELRQREAGTIAVDESEVEEYYEREQDSFPQRPPSVTLHQAFIAPQPTEASMAEARTEVERILGMLEEGDDFAELARRFSDDPGSAEGGGELGWLRRGAGLEQPFEESAFQLREGQVVGPVETSRGAHIIRVDRIRGPERRISHILIQAEADREQTRSRAEQVRADVEAGTPLLDIADELDDPVNQSGRFQYPLDQIDEFPSDYANAVRQAEPGDLLGPIELPLEEDESRSAWVVVEIVDVREAGEYTIDDLRAQLRNFLRSEKFTARLVERLRARTHIEIRI